MLRAKARRMGNDILVFADGKVFKARPEGWDQQGFVNSLKRTFTLKYQFYDDAGIMISRVEHNFFKDSFVIQKNEEPLAEIVRISSPKKGKRVAGLNRGKIRMSDDFDAPLPDEFWLCEQ